jgi:2-polyprenyl-3-methyl-5-hydroxy-6-metoxy-1,4-benzoquinol methylase
MLDILMEERESEFWDKFYSDREKEIPFFKNKVDENLVDYIKNDYLKPGRTLEIGCGPGRNAIYLAKNNFAVEAIDYSEVSIEWAEDRAEAADVSVDFQCLSFFDYDTAEETFDFIYDSGVLHHIKPHRRFEYLRKIWKLLKPNSYFALVCFNLKGGANISDYDVYRNYSMKGGLGFSEYKLKKVLSPFFDIIEFREMKKMETDLFGEEFLWTALMKKSRT